MQTNSFTFGVCTQFGEKPCAIKGTVEISQDCDEQEANCMLETFIRDLRMKVRFVYHPDLQAAYNKQVEAAIFH